MENLALETVLHIMKNLSDIDVVCLTSCNWRLYRIRWMCEFQSTVKVMHVINLPYYQSFRRLITPNALLPLPRNLTHLTIDTSGSNPYYCHDMNAVDKIWNSIPQLRSLTLVLPLSSSLAKISSLPYGLRELVIIGQHNGTFSIPELPFTLQKLTCNADIYQRYQICHRQNLPLGLEKLSLHFDIYSPSEIDIQMSNLQHLEILSKKYLSSIQINRNLYSTLKSLSLCANCRFVTNMIFHDMKQLEILRVHNLPTTDMPESLRRLHITNDDAESVATTRLPRGLEYLWLDNIDNTAVKDQAVFDGVAYPVFSNMWDITETMPYLRELRIGHMYDLVLPNLALTNIVTLQLECNKPWILSELPAGLRSLTLIYAIWMVESLPVLAQLESLTCHRVQKLQFTTPNKLPNLRTLTLDAASTPTNLDLTPFTKLETLTLDASVIFNTIYLRHCDSLHKLSLKGRIPNLALEQILPPGLRELEISHYNTNIDYTRIKATTRLHFV